VAIITDFYTFYIMSLMNIIRIEKRIHMVNSLSTITREVSV